MNFTKMHGAGNDFLLVEGNEDRDWTALSQAMCERQFGAGADGVILVLPSSKADVRMRLVRLSMGPRRFGPKDAPVVAEMSPPVIDLPLEVDGEHISVTCLSMGNPHAVKFIDSPVADYPLETIGSKVEHH